MGDGDPADSAAVVDLERALRGLSVDDRRLLALEIRGWDGLAPDRAPSRPVRLGRAKSADTTDPPAQD